MELKVKLVDSSDRVVARDVPLTARLLYESGVEVPEQNKVLKVATGSGKLVQGYGSIKVGP